MPCDRALSGQPGKSKLIPKCRRNEECDNSTKKERTYSCKLNVSIHKWFLLWDMFLAKLSNINLTSIFCLSASKIRLSLNCFQDMPKSKSFWREVSKDLSSRLLESTWLSKSEKIKKSGSHSAPHRASALTLLDKDKTATSKVQASSLWGLSSPGSTSFRCFIRFKNSALWFKMKILRCCSLTVAISQSAIVYAFWIYNGLKDS